MEWGEGGGPEDLVCRVGGRYWGFSGWLLNGNDTTRDVVIGGASVKASGEQGRRARSYHRPVLHAACGTQLCLDADGFNVHFGAVFEEGVEVGGDRKDIEEGVAEECRHFATDVDILNEIGTRIRLERDISPSPLGTYWAPHRPQDSGATRFLC